ncbi:hypothetical protein GYMLUDRAFT_86155 [Collybiopsis luxurians FD-317 M1]|uniref:F-box domain-containing protein n=1 Tax=Collybiopsis luxurians FD-317 M1 TaxID=944289 RepID=A0A0D0BTL5_9AGAR|nr:hypothetical protein GYMLUDRAFT_86155 [Collybiopsis luxurians FD-317 M1]
MEGIATNLFQGRQYSFLSLPLEIKFEVTSYLEPGEILALSGTCHIMRDVLLSTVFRRVVIRPNIDEEVMIRARASKTRHTLYRTLKQVGYVPEDILPSVRECAIRGWRNLSLSSHAVDALISAYTNCLPRMKNVISLTLVNVVLTPSLLLNLRGFSHLKSLSLRACDFRQVSVINVRKFVAGLQVEKLELLGIVGTRANGNNHDGIVEAFRSAAGNLVELRHDLFGLTKALSFSLAIPPLQVLNISLGYCDSDINEALDFISKISTLVSITIEDHTRFGLLTFLRPVRRRISLSSLPSLRRLTCPPKFVSALVGSHNLTALTFRSAFVSYPDPDQANDVRPALSQMLSESDAWFRISRYQSLQELHIPLAFALSLVVDANDDCYLLRLRKLVFDANATDIIDIVYDQVDLNMTFLRLLTTFSTPSLKHLGFIKIALELQNLKRDLKQDLIHIQQRCFSGLERFSVRFMGGGWDFEKDSKNEDWVSFDRKESDCV